MTLWQVNPLIHFSLLAMLLMPAINSIGETTDFKTKQGPITTAAENIRKTIFSDSLNTPSCLAIGRGYKSNLPKVSKELDVLAQKITSLLQKRNDKEMRKLFHPRLKVTRFQTAKFYDDLLGFYGTKNYDATPYRIYAINTVDGTPHDINCVDDGVIFQAHYGFGLQFGLWFQIRGSEELGRLFLTLVPDPNGWYIGSWHQQQWTHKGLDYQRWLEKALAESSAGRRLGAYVMYDIAAKLLEGGKHLKIQLQDQAITARNSMLPNDSDWLKVIQKALPNEAIGYAGTGLMKDGAGIFLRFQLTEKMPVEKIDEHCINNGKKLYQADWTQNLGGLQCGYIPKGAPVDQDSPLGSTFKTRQELETYSKPL